MSAEKKVACPFCGEEIDSDALRCSNCGNGWDGPEEREAIRAIMKMPGMGEKRTRKLYEAGFKRIKDIEDADIKDILEKAGIPVSVAREVKERIEERKGLYLCPACGAFVSSEATECPICGAALYEEAEVEEEDTEGIAPDLSALEDDLQIEERVSLYVCRICGAFVSGDAKRCPVCSAPMPENRAETPQKIKDDLLEDENANITAIKKFFGVEEISSISEISLPTDDILETTPEIDMCGNCGAFVRPEALQCPVCGAALIPEISVEEEIKAEEEALNALEELKNELVGAEIVAGTEEEPPAEESGEETVEYVCPECGSAVPKDAVTCPECDAVFGDTEDETEEGVVLPLDSVISEEALHVEKEPAEEEIKAEVESLLKTQKKPEKELIESFELEYGLEGGFDEIASIEVREKETAPKMPKLEIPKKLRDWHRVEDLLMASGSIAAVLLAAEYLLTYPVVKDPKMAYGSAAVLVFIPILAFSLLMLFVDRKKVFSNLTSSAFLLAPFLMALFVPLRWFLALDFQRPLLSDIMIMAFSAVLLLAILRIFKGDTSPFWLFFLGISLISLHSVLFLTDFYTLFVPEYDNVPSLGIPIMGGAMLAMSVYLRIDSAVRSLLATRDVLLGHRHYMGGEYDEAMKYYTRAIKRKRGDESGYDLAYYSKGTALLSAGNAVEALRYLNKALKENPGNEMAWNNRGIALSKLGLTEAALKSYDEAIRLNPRYDVAWNNRGNALARIGRYEEALECYDKALSINPEYTDAWMNKGYVLIKLDRYREAKECAEHILPSARKTVKGGRRAERTPV